MIFKNALRNAGNEISCLFLIFLQAGQKLFMDKYINFVEIHILDCHLHKFTLFNTIYYRELK